MPDGLPDEIRDFIRKHVSSIEQLEILTHLHQISPEMQTSDSVAHALHLSEESVARQLGHFHEKGLVTSTGGAVPRYSIESKNSATGQSIFELARLYRERRVTVINEIFSNPISTIQTFADAFIIGRKKE